MRLLVLALIAACALGFRTSKLPSVYNSFRKNTMHISAEGGKNGMGDKVDMQGRPGMKGYYRRPSRAIEKGGGFFVPGLEGERIRLITAVALVLMFAANRAGQVSAMQSLSQIVSEVTGLVMALILFLQGGAELFGLEFDADGDADDLNLTNTNINTGSSGGTELPQVSYLSVIQSSSAPSASAPILESIARSLALTNNNVIYVCALSPPANPSSTSTINSGDSVIDASSSSGTDWQVLLEFGPINHASMSVVALKEVACGAVDLLLLGGGEKESKSQIDSNKVKPGGGQLLYSVESMAEFQRRTRDVVPLPRGTGAVRQFIDPSGRYWLVAATDIDPAAEETKDRRWLQSLLSTPC